MGSDDAYAGDVRQRRAAGTGEQTVAREQRGGLDPHPAIRVDRRHGRPVPASAAAQPSLENHLLSVLDRATYAALEPHFETVSLALRTVVYETGAPIDYVYFPESAVFSMVRQMSDGAGVEVGTVGYEGVVGGAFLHAGGRATARCLVQISGRAKRIPSTAVRAAVGQSGSRAPGQQHEGSGLADVLQRYAYALFEQVAQSAACNRLHSLEQRCARWLLMTQDRVRGNELDLTQEFLSFMLGVRRAGVTEACGTLQRSGLIRYRRGHITVIDRAGLERAACECYRVAATLYDSLLGPLPRGEPERTT